MGNAISEPKKKPLTIHDLKIKVGEYKTIQEGDPEMKEDPEFPTHMLHEAMDNNNTIQGNIVKGTYVYYPNKNKPKMWIGNYKILNPEDILCKDVAAKIGMSEIQWKKYIEHKKNGKPLKGYEDYDFLTEEQRNALCNVVNNHNGENPCEKYYAKNQISESSFTENPLSKQTFDENSNINYKLFQEYMASRNEQNIEQQRDSLNPNMEKDFMAYNHNIYNEVNLDEEILADPYKYINRLNDEAYRIRKEQEEEINKQQKNLMYYCNSNMGCNGEVTAMPTDYVVPQNEMTSIQFLDGEPVDYLEEGELGELYEHIQLTNLRCPLQEEVAEDVAEEVAEEEAEEEAEERDEKKTPEKKEKKKIQEQSKTEKTAQAQKKPQKKKEKAKEEPIKAKVNSFMKKESFISKAENFSKKNPTRTNRSIEVNFIKNNLNMNKVRIITTTKNKNMKNTTLKKAVL